MDVRIKSSSSSNDCLECGSNFVEVCRVSCKDGKRGFHKSGLIPKYCPLEYRNYHNVITVNDQKPKITYAVFKQLNGTKYLPKELEEGLFVVVSNETEIPLTDEFRDICREAIKKFYSYVYSG